VSRSDRPAVRSSSNAPSQSRSGGVYGAARPSDGRGPAGRGPSGRGPSGPPGGKTYGGGKPPGGGRPSSGKGSGPKRRKPIGSIISIFFGVVLMLVSVGVYVTVHQVIAAVNTVPTANLLGNSNTGTSIKGVINLLMIGVDTRPNNTIGSRSDSIIIVHIPASHNAAYLVSIPRDTVVPIPGHGSTKINAAFQFGSSNGGGYAGGAQLLTKTLESNWGLTFNGAMIVNFNGFEAIVKALGGVTMYIDEKTTSLHNGYKIVNGKHVFAAPYVTYNSGLTWHKVPGVTPWIYNVGTRHMTPSQALDYVRIRDFLPNGDYDRERHQQQFIKAIMAEAVSQGISDPLKISGFLDSIKSAFVWDGHGISNADWIFTLKSLSPSDMLTIKTNNGTYNTTVVNGQDQEVLDATSLELLADVKNDTLGTFIQQHPTWVSSS
jgi:polyisoprenyl-teichoic acid--peptidoglycan teichoic acid transferase